MFDHRHYVPILHGKKGEFRALKELSNNVKQLITPLIDIPRVEFDWNNNRPKGSLQAHLKRKASEIKVVWGNSRPLFIDLSAISLEDRIINGIHPLRYLFERLRDNAVQAIPTTSLDRDENYNQAVSNLLIKDQRGVCLRILRGDMEFIEELGEKLDSLMAALKVSRQETHLLLDFEYVESENVDKTSNTAVKTIHSLPGIREWKTLTVAASGMPQSLAVMVKAKSEGRIRRSEFAVWTKILNRGGDLERKPTYGDYGTRHPDFLHLDPRKINKTLTPDIRYALDHEWLILRFLIRICARVRVPGACRDSDTGP